MSLTAIRKRRLRSNATFAAAILAALAAAAVGLRLLPPLVADSLAETYLVGQAPAKERYVLEALSHGEAAFGERRLTPSDEAYLSMLAHISEFTELSLLDRDGVIFWSTRIDLIGHVHAGDTFSERVLDDRIHYGLELIAPRNLSGFTAPASQPEPRAIADVVVPVRSDGVVIGGIEIRQDITELRSLLVERARIALALLALVILLSLVAVALTVRHAGRVETRAAEERAAQQQALMAEQLRLAREVRLLGELNEWLQSCRSLSELFSMVGRFLAHILPGASGSLYVYSNSRDVLEGAVSWSGGAHADHIRAEDCWGLRRGRTYAYGGHEVDFSCAHVQDAAPRPYLCMPILAHGETVGLMSLTAREGTSPEAFEAIRRIAQMSAEQISLAVANVRLRDELHHQAVRDPLTGLFNRRHLIDVLRRLIDGRFPGGVALVSIDVDHFKRFNDNHGHDAGDMVLRAVGEVLSRHADGDRLACRIGGEEFMLLLPGASDDAALAEAEALREGVAELSVRYGDKTLPRITVSVGVARYPEDGALPQDAIRAADDALYEAKGRGRNQVVAAGRPRDAAAPPTPANAAA